MSLVDRLDSICSGEKGYCERPWPILGRLVATDGKLFVSVEVGDELTNGMAVAPDDVRYGLVRFLEHAIDGAPFVPFKILVEWAGSSKLDTERCDICNMVGKRTCTCCDGAGWIRGVLKEKIQCVKCRGKTKLRCDACNGSGRKPRPRLGWIGEAFMNRQLLARGLQAVRGRGDRAVRVQVGSALDPIYFDGVGWRIVLMPRNDGDSGGSAPRLELTAEPTADVGEE